MRVAHLIMAYKYPEQVEKLIHSMSHPNFFFYIHLDQKIDIKDFEYLEKLERVVFIKNRTLCNWGGFSFVEAIFTSVKEILNLNEGYHFINLMSGQDYPIKPVGEIYEFLLKNEGNCFVSYDKDHKRKWWAHAMQRLEHYHLTDMRFKGKYVVQWMLNKFLPKRVFPLNLPLYGSSDSTWWTITSECAAYMVKFIERHPKLTRFLRYTWGADELVVATIVMNSPFKDKVINNNLRLINWSEGLANPHILTSHDFDDIKTSDRFFARKFDIQIDPLILETLDAYLKVKE
jgi:hypothetical protein